MNPGCFPNHQTTFYQSGPVALPASGLVVNVFHGMPGTPQLLRWVLICKVAELGYVVADEVDVASFNSNNSESTPEFSWGANMNKVFLTLQTQVPYALGKSSATAATITKANWQAKCYAWYFDFNRQ